MNEENTDVPSEVSKRGRPTKFDDQLRRRLIELIELGTPYRHACAACGIAYQSFLSYREKFPDFDLEIEQALARRIERNLRIIQTAADKGDTNSAKWILERLHPGDFARSRLEIVRDGVPMVVDICLPEKDSREPQSLPEPDTD